MTGHAVVIAGGGPAGLMLAGELALADADVAIVERRASQDVTGSRAGGLHSRTIEVLDQRGIAGRFLAQGTVGQVVNFSGIPLDIGDFPTRHPYGLGLWQEQIERILSRSGASAATAKASITSASWMAGDGRRCWCGNSTSGRPASRRCVSSARRSSPSGERITVLLNLGEPGGFDITPWADRVQLVDAAYAGL
jgi:hypothetical protein